ncbi:hypothetical protein Brsp01_45940 [Brucella sp. NBRC 12950]|nr:hypothetical protein Brsp01_45940 [Brucella sp. NBRC 12950]
MANGIAALRLIAITPGIDPEKNPTAKLEPTENSTTDNVINAAFHKAAFMPMNSPKPR